MKIEILDFITRKEAESISKFIIEENKIESHMIEKTPEKIFLSAKKYWCVKLLKEWNIIWFMGLYNYLEYYEAWTLCIWKQFRNIWLWTMVQKILLDNFSDLPIFLVTNTQKVRNISENTWLFEIKIPELPESILETIEKWGKILSDDSVYLSKQLFSNELFYSIKIKKNKLPLLMYVKVVLNDNDLLKP